MTNTYKQNTYAENIAFLVVNLPKLAKYVNSLDSSDHCMQMVLIDKNTRVRAMLVLDYIFPSEYGYSQYDGERVYLLPSGNIICGYDFDIKSDDKNKKLVAFNKPDCFIEYDMNTFLSYDVISTFQPNLIGKLSQAVRGLMSKYDR